MALSEDASFRAEAGEELRVSTPTDLRLTYCPTEKPFQTGGNLWIFYDIRQYLNRNQEFQPGNGVEITGPAGTEWEGVPLVKGGVVRTFDTHPRTPEFLHAVHIRCTRGSVAPGERVTIRLRTHPDGFLLPQNAISAFHFWLVEDPEGRLTFHHPGGKYHFFLPREAAPILHTANPLTVLPGPLETLRLTCPSTNTGKTTVRVTGLDAFGNPVPISGRLSLETQADRADIETHGRITHRADLRTGAPYDRITAVYDSLESRSNPTRTADHRSPEHTLYWGDIHGMLFNQRPIADYFAWAQDIAHLDFAGGQLFSYSACIAEVWAQLQDAWRAHNRPGAFIALPSVEYGTPPDGSHRLGFFPTPEGRPPIFCEDRPEAHDPKLHARFHPDTIYCKDYRELYDAVHAQGGFTQAHFHAAFYEQERVVEIYQKQRVNPGVEEAKINRAIQFQGLKPGIVSGSDTHDSRPANPYPEPGPDRPAGLTGLWAERLDRTAVFDAFFARRCYATTGARIRIDFRVNGRPMGETVSAPAHEFTADILGTAEIDRVELVVNGAPTHSFTPGKQDFALSGEIPLPYSPSGIHYCYLRLWQRDGHRAWTSPIWLEKSQKLAPLHRDTNQC